MTPKTVRLRSVCPEILNHARNQGLCELQARILAGRLRISDGDLDGVISPSLKKIPPPHLLADAEKAANRIAQAINNGEQIGLLTDYDVDGITSHALAIEILTNVFGQPSERVISYIGHRIHEGYGVSDSLTQRILDDPQRPDVIVTADCGSSDEDTLAKLKASGIDVIVSDHHGLPESGTPRSAYATVNPIRSNCGYPDKAIAGCMVTWLLLSQVRSSLIQQQQLSSDTPKLSRWLDFVALGTVADAVSLKSNVNRAVVCAGLTIMNQKRRFCWQAMAQELECDSFETEHLGFQIGPRINARGRLADPLAALQFLTAKTPETARLKLETLNQDNLDRREIERGMVKQAKILVTQSTRFCHVIFHHSFHAGVQGIVASRLVDSLGKPAVVLSPGRDTGFATGSARSIPSVHIRDALQQIHQRRPELLYKFGGHAGAAGLTLPIHAVDDFATLLDEIIGFQLNSLEPSPQIWTDGELGEDELTFHSIDQLNRLQPYGRGFEVPLFVGMFQVNDVKTVGKEGNHLQLSLTLNDSSYPGIWFNAYAPGKEDIPVASGNLVECAYRLERNTFRKETRLQLIIEYAQIAH